MAAENDDRIEVFNINTPGKSGFVQRKFYDEMRRAMLLMLPGEPPGMTQIEMTTEILRFLSDEIYPGGEKSGWWLKCVQLDLEARNIILRIKGRPVRWHKNNLAGEIIPVKTKNTKPEKHPVHIMPADIQALLVRNNLLDAYNERPYYQRNDYLGWILDAKRDATRARRTDQMLEELRTGDRYMNMEYPVRKN